MSDPYARDLADIARVRASYGNFYASSASNRQPRDESGPSDVPADLDLSDMPDVETVTDQGYDDDDDDDDGDGMSGDA
jgi:hypothetical protein